MQLIGTIVWLTFRVFWNLMFIAENKQVRSVTKKKVLLLKKKKQSLIWPGLLVLLAILEKSKFTPSLIAACVKYMIKIFVVSQLQCNH